MEQKNIAFSNLIFLFLYFDFVSENLNFVCSPIDLIADINFIDFWTEIDYVWYNFFLSFLLTEVNLFLLNVAGLIYLDGKLAEAKSIGTKSLMFEFGRYVTKQVDLGLIHIQKTIFEYSGQNWVSEGNVFVFALLGKGKVINDCIQGKKR